MIAKFCVTYLTLQKRDKKHWTFFAPRCAHCAVLTNILTIAIEEGRTMTFFAFFHLRIWSTVSPPGRTEFSRKNANKNVKKLSFLADVNSRSRSLLAIAIPSVCCLSSVTLVHPTQAVELFGNFFHHTIAQGLYFSGAKNHWWGRPFPPEICVQSNPPPFKQRNFDKYRLIAPQPW